MRERRLADTARWRLDSLREDSRQKAMASRQPPYEVRRVQAMSHCAVSYVFRDAAWSGLQLFTIRATEWGDTVPVAHGHAYSESGFAPGDTVTVVLPDVACGAPIVVSLGAARIHPQEPIRVEKR